MNILLAGYGSIGRAFESIYRNMGCTDSLTVCELGKGDDCLDFIRDPARHWDMVINLTGMSSDVIFPVCFEREIDYIDAALEDESIEVPETEDPAVYYQHYLDMAGAKPKGRAMFGFGMNPGIIEHIYFSHKPVGKHIAIELEYDSAEKNGEVFCTWSPVSYFLESVRAAKIVSIAKNPYRNFASIVKDRLPIRMTVDGEVRNFCLIPHEESFSVLRNSPDCRAFAFCYQAPLQCQRYLQKNLGGLTPEAVREIPVLHDVRGVDSIGMLFYDGSDNLYYVRNKASHEEKFREIGSNATCWQTASGVFVAYRLIPLLNKGEAVTMSDISMRFKPEIDAVLKDLNFEITRTDYAVDPGEFRREILDWLEPEL